MPSSLTYNSKPTKLQSGDLICFDQNAQSIMLIRDGDTRKIRDERGIRFGDQDKFYIGQDITLKQMNDIANLMAVAAGLIGAANEEKVFAGKNMKHCLRFI